MEIIISIDKLDVILLFVIAGVLLFSDLPFSRLHPLPVFIWAGASWSLLESCHSGPNTDWLGVVNRAEVVMNTCEVPVIPNESPRPASANVLRECGTLAAALSWLSTEPSGGALVDSAAARLRLLSCFNAGLCSRHV